MLIERRLRRNEDCQQKCNVRPLKNGAKEKKKDRIYNNKEWYYSLSLYISIHVVPACCPMLRDKGGLVNPCVACHFSESSALETSNDRRKFVIVQ